MFVGEIFEDPDLPFVVKPAGRLIVATGGSPWCGMQYTTEPRQGRLKASITPNVLRIIFNAVGIEEREKLFRETSSSMMLLLAFDVSAYPRRHGMTHAEGGIPALPRKRAF